MSDTQTAIIPASHRDGNFEVKLILHSRSVFGHEAITAQATYERFIHDEFLAHRGSRNASSLRARPIKGVIQQIRSGPAQHLHLGANQGGMVMGGPIDNQNWFLSRDEDLRERTIATCEAMESECRPHKSVINRYLERWAWITTVSTMGLPQFRNFVRQRCDPRADPNMQRLAIWMLRLYCQSIPQVLNDGEWHIPYSDPGASTANWTMAEREAIDKALIWSVARCAWVSYDKPGKQTTFEHAKERHDACVSVPHPSPLEHQLKVCQEPGSVVPGYRSYRAMTESMSGPPKCDFAEVLAQYEGVDFLLPIGGL